MNGNGAGGGAKPPVIAITELTKTYKMGETEVHALRGISLTIQEGEYVAIIEASGSGKSTVANVVDQLLRARGVHTYLLDGDNVRHGLNRDLGFTQQDRVENVRRVTEVAALMADAGLIVLVAMISPFRAERAQARERLAASGFLEVFIDTPLVVAESRDVKGLYARARAGELRNFTGVDSPYEPPLEPDIHIDTAASTPVAAAEQIVAALLADAVSRASR